MGKFIGFVFLTGSIIAAMVGAYYVGHQSISPKASPNTLSKTVPSVTPMSRELSATDSAKLATPSGELILAKKTIYMGALLYQLYSIDVLPGWTEIRGESDDTTNKLTLIKGEYELTIYQANTGGGICSFPDELVEAGPLVYQYSKDSYIDLTGVSGETYRRVQNTEESTEEKNIYSICDKRREQYQQPTRYGHITYKTPVEPDEDILKNMDLMVSSVKDRR